MSGVDLRHSSLQLAGGSGQPCYLSTTDMQFISSLNCDSLPSDSSPSPPLCGSVPHFVGPRWQDGNCHSPWLTGIPVVTSAAHASLTFNHKWQMSHGIPEMMRRIKGLNSVHDEEGHKTLLRLPLNNQSVIVPQISYAACFPFEIMKSLQWQNKVEYAAVDRTLAWA